MREQETKEERQISQQRSCHYKSMWLDVISITFVVLWLKWIIIVVPTKLDTTMVINFNRSPTHFTQFERRRKRRIIVYGHSLWSANQLPAQVRILFETKITNNLKQQIVLILFLLLFLSIL